MPQQGRYETYEVPLRENQTVLDVVTFVQRHLDPTLVLSVCLPGRHVRFLRDDGERPTALDLPHACIEGGRAAVASRSARLRTCPVIKDLGHRHAPVLREVAAGQRRVRAVENAPRCHRADQAGQRGRALLPMPPSNASIAVFAMPPAIPCAGIADYLGPAALNRAWTLVNDERDAGNRAALAGRRRLRGGCHACHSHQSCQEHCPQALNPTASIAGLKRRTMQRLSQRRDQGMNVRLYVWQRLTAAIMVPLVLVHVAVIFYATRKGMTRRRHPCAHARQHRCGPRSTASSSSPAAVHAAIGLRNVLTEWSPLETIASPAYSASAFGFLLLVLGLRAVAAVVLS